MSAINENTYSKGDGEFKEKKSNFGKDFQDFKKVTGTLAGDAAHVVQDNAAEYYDKGIVQAKKFGKMVERRIQNHPLQSLLIIGSVGLVLGALWNRR